MIEYFYSAHSAFAYLGSRRFIEIARAAGREIRHKPYDLRRGVVGVGSTPTGSRPGNHRAYFFGREIQRWSELREAPVVQGMPTHHFNDIALPNRLLIAAQARALDVDKLAHALLQAHWRDDADLADPRTLSDLAEALDMPGTELLDEARGDAATAEYEANTEEAIRRSVFGSPTYFVNGDMFYGQDHLEMVERALVRPFRGSWPPART
ncbi:MAG: 2-hydroxychromene-2-carboxylate isomerase [Gammaproteobacteria bacterium]|nr:2-hydroxychromene-2-carboxylate isomerase [Gammaproteobacteria bacterium]